MRAGVIGADAGDGQASSEGAAISPRPSRVEARVRMQVAHGPRILGGLASAPETKAAPTIAIVSSRTGSTKSKISACVS